MEINTRYKMPRPINYINKMKKHVAQMDKAITAMKGIVSSYENSLNKPAPKQAKKKVGKK